MDVQEAKRSKADLERAIAKLLETFQNATGLTVAEIQLKPPVDYLGKNEDGFYVGKEYRKVVVVITL
jgi:hypothetical protein